MLDLTPSELRTYRIFHPYAFEKTVEALGRPLSFVHYCTAEAALSMLQKEEVWLRNVTWMNDSSEITYGRERLSAAVRGADGRRLADFLESKLPGFTERFANTFNSWVEVFQTDTYIACLTEQLEHEDKIGRLSMWRAYGGAGAVAFIVDSGPFLRPSYALNAYTSPVGYFTEERFNLEFSRVVDGIIDNFDFLIADGADQIFNNLFAAFRFAVCCTKHPSFYEEREWRIIYQPSFEPSARLREDTISIKGRPQRIFKIPLEDYPEEGFYGATLPELLKGLLIGPGADAEHMRREFAGILSRAGVEGASEKVRISDVPLRF